MRGYSRRHYRVVSPAADTAAQIRERLIRQRAGELAVDDRLREFPTLSDANADRAIRYQEERIVYHVAAFNDPARPNHGRTREQIEQLVRGGVLQRVDDGPEVAALLAALVDRILETGESLWHAFAQVAGRPCDSALCLATQSSASRLPA